MAMGPERNIAAEAPRDVGPWLLLAEFNHRVRNELMAALSALRVAQRGGRAGVEPAVFLDQAVERLENFSRIHHILDRGQDHGSLRQRLEALCRAVAQSRGATDGIHVVLSAENVQADEETAWTVCVAASELMTNAFRHAFHQTRGGVVGVSLREEREWILLTIADNGLGFAPRDLRPKVPGPGLGSAIVAELAERLGGCVSLCSGPAGSAVTVKVPADRVRQ
jgi:two-component sensor histidine kinase